MCELGVLLLIVDMCEFECMMFVLFLCFGGVVFIDL